MLKFPDFTYENNLWQKNFTVVGIDEVGRGAFAGPVGIGGVVFSSALSNKKKKYLLSMGINDSKKLTAKKREYLSEIIKEACVVYETSFINVATINKIGIGKATFMGMRDVAEKIKAKLKTEDVYFLIDAFEIPNSMYLQKGIIRGDSLSISIASASIIAKVERDKLMKELGISFPSYLWEKNKGYGTLSHRSAIKQFGLSKLHRRTFCKNTIHL